MNKTEVAQLLTLVSMFDSRTVGVETVEAWHTILEPFKLDDAVTAVRNHFATQTTYLMPAHVVAGCKSMRGLKLASDASYYCKAHGWPVEDCPRCAEDN